MKTLCFSSFTFSYANRAHVLFDSVRRFHPDWHIVALITDRPPLVYEDKLVSDGVVDDVVWFDDLPIENRMPWLFKHDIVEISTAVKGVYLPIALNEGWDRIVYLDPDTCLFNSLSPVVDALSDSDILLTPHQLSPSNERLTIIDNEITSLKTGIYNLGFFAISNRPEARRFADWWKVRCTEFCIDDIPNGLFVDQRWCDHVPVFFPNMKIVREPGCNVASWNLNERKVSFGLDGDILVNGTPLRFWHFTKLGPVGDIMTKKYALDNFQVYELWRWYRAAVTRATNSAIPRGYWHFGNYHDGRKILKGHRILYRMRKDLQNAFLDPYSSGAGTFQEWLEIAVDEGTQKILDMAEGFVPV